MQTTGIAAYNQHSCLADDCARTAQFFRIFALSLATPLVVVAGFVFYRSVRPIRWSSRQGERFPADGPMERRQVQAGPLTAGIVSHTKR